MSHKLAYLALAGAVAALAGCSSNGTYAGLDDDFAAAAAGLIDTETGALLADARVALPSSGTATYSGFVSGEVDGAGMIGELDLEVTFQPGSNGTVTGAADRFVHETDGAYAGTLTLNNGNIVPNAGAGGADLLAGNLEGTLSNGGVDHATNIGLDGSFLGGGGSDVPGAIAGGAVGTVGTEAFEGMFVTLR